MSGARNNRIWSVVVWYPWDGTHMRRVVFRDGISYTEARHILREQEALGRRVKLETSDEAPQTPAEIAERERQDREEAEREAAKAARLEKARESAEQAKRRQGSLFPDDPDPDDPKER